MKHKSLFSILFCSTFSILFSFVGIYAEGKKPSLPKNIDNWYSHTEVVKKTIEKFESFSTYQANFSITKTKRGASTTSGVVYYKKPSRIRYEFKNPQGNLIISDGKKMWFYVSKLKTVGKQDLSLSKKDANGKAIFRETPATGVKRLFTKYHYRFDSLEQPKSFPFCNCFVLDLDQREKIGGYVSMKVYIDSKRYLIKKSEGIDASGSKHVITFSDIVLNKQLEGKLFQFQANDKIQVVQNPFVKE